MNEFLEYPRRITSVTSLGASSSIVFTTAERIGGFFYKASAAGAQTVTFSDNDSIPYFQWVIPQSTSGFCPARWFAFNGLTVGGITANAVDLYILIVDVGKGKFVDPLS